MCLDVGYATNLTCTDTPRMKALAACYKDGWQLFTADGIPVTFYPNPHFVKWKRGRPTKEALAKRELARQWMPEEWGQNAEG